MKKFFKTLGMGLLYVVTLPLIVLVLAIMMIYCIGLFFVLFFKSIVCFFMGKSIFRDLEEDIEAQHIIEMWQTNPESQYYVPQTNRKIVTNNPNDIFNKETELNETKEEVQHE